MNRNSVLALFLVASQVVVLNARANPGDVIDQVIKQTGKLIDGPSTYYEFKDDVYLDLQNPGASDPKILHFHKGQIVAFDPETNSINVERADGSHTTAVIQAKYRGPEFMYPEPLDSAEDNDAEWLVPNSDTKSPITHNNIFRFADSAKELGKSTGPPAYPVNAIKPDNNGIRHFEIQSSEIIDLGYGDRHSYHLVHKVCYQDINGGRPCGYVPAEDVGHYQSKGDLAQHAFEAPSGSMELPLGKIVMIDTPAKRKAYEILSAAEDRDDAETAKEALDFLNNNAPMPMMDDAAEIAKYLSCTKSFDLLAQVNSAMRAIEKTPGFKSLNEEVGSCNADENTSFAGMRNKNIYDQVALANMRHEYPRVAKVKKADGSPLTKQDFLDMDVLARTIYGEMSACAAHDPKTGRVTSIYPAPFQYKQAVACTLIKRADEGASDVASSNKKISSNPRFIGGPQSSLRTGGISRAALAPMQFSMWNHPSRGNPKALLDRVLCPNKQSRAWREARDVAIDTLLNLKSMKNRCSDVNTAYYTSYVKMPPNKFWKWSERTPPAKIDGQTLDDKNCIRLWDQHQ